MFGNRRIL